jgi:MoxR-like ATPase
VTAADAVGPEEPVAPRPTRATSTRATSTRATPVKAPARARTPRRAPEVTADEARQALVALRAEVGKAVIGQDATVTGLVIALLCRGHVLLEGVPGVAKTLLVRACAPRCRSTPSACSSRPT